MYSNLKRLRLVICCKAARAPRAGAMEAELTQLVAKPITAVAWKKDRSAVAVSPGDETILIFTRPDNKWVLSHTLLEHDQRVTGLDWFSGPGGDRLLSCSADRNAYVWAGGAGAWTPSLVNLRFKRAATCAQWTPDGTKFAVGGVEGQVAVGHYDDDVGLWACRALKKVIDGPVLSLAWHPAGTVLAVGTLAGSLHVLSAFLTAADMRRTGEVAWLDAPAAGTFDVECFTVEVHSWVRDIAFSKSGGALAWTTQAAVTSVFYPASGFQSSVTHAAPGQAKLPMNRLLFLSEGVLMAAGHGAAPLLLSGGDRKEWRLQAELAGDALAPPAAQPAGSGVGNQDTARAFGGAFAKFQMVDQQGKTADEAATRISSSKRARGHLSAVTAVSPLDAAQQTGRVATMGLDGRMVVWSVGSLAAQCELEGL